MCGGADNMATNDDDKWRQKSYTTPHPTDRKLIFKKLDHNVTSPLEPFNYQQTTVLNSDPAIFSNSVRYIA